MNDYTYKCEKGFNDCWDCPNFVEEENDTSMESERYKCEKCGQVDRLYYEDMA